MDTINSRTPVMLASMYTIHTYGSVMGNTIDTPIVSSQWNVEIPKTKAWFRCTGLFSMNGGWDELDG